MIEYALRLVESGKLPDWLVAKGVRTLVAERLKNLECQSDGALYSDELLSALKGEVAAHTEAANEQHYELPPEFFALCLGQHRKYSGCYYPQAELALSVAEEESLKQVCERAELCDGMDILELGCGWGSLTLFMARRFPRARIVAVSNSAPQRSYLESVCREEGLQNVEIRTADINTFEPQASFDRVVSVEMFEHVRNHAELMRRIAGWLKPEGKLFVHIFCHRFFTYLFETEGPKNWMGRYFFTGGIMPSAAHLVRHQQHLRLEQQWWLSGIHYSRTAQAWLENLDRNRSEVLRIFAAVYPAAETELWLQRWRLFFMACRELFGYRGGKEWGISHYLFVPQAHSPARSSP